MDITLENIHLFFELIKKEGLPIDISVEQIKTYSDFEKQIRKHFGISMASLILCEDAIVDAPLYIDGTVWEKLIAKWRLSIIN